MDLLGDITLRLGSLIAFSILLGIAVGFTIAYFRPMGPSRNTRKLLDITIILVSLIAVTQTMLDLRKQVALNISRGFPNSSIYLEILPFKAPANSGDCQKHERSKLSPQNFDQIEKDRRAFCTWLDKFHTANKETPIRWANVKFPPLPAHLPLISASIPKAFPFSLTSEVVHNLERYRDDKKEHDQLMAVASNDSADQNVIGSILISFAAGLALARVFFAGRLSY